MLRPFQIFQYGLGKVLTEEQVSSFEDVGLKQTIPNRKRYEDIIGGISNEVILAEMRDATTEAEVTNAINKLRKINSELASRCETFLNWCYMEYYHAYGQRVGKKDLQDTVNVLRYTNRDDNEIANLLGPKLRDYDSETLPLNKSKILNELKAIVKAALEPAATPKPLPSASTSTTTPTPTPISSSTEKPAVAQTSTEKPKELQTIASYLTKAEEIARKAVTPEWIAEHRTVVQQMLEFYIKNAATTSSSPHFIVVEALNKHFKENKEIGNEDMETISFIVKEMEAIKNKSATEQISEIEKMESRVPFLSNKILNVMKTAIQPIKQKLTAVAPITPIAQTVTPRFDSTIQTPKNMLTAKGNIESVKIDIEDRINEEGSKWTCQENNGTLHITFNNQDLYVSPNSDNTVSYAVKSAMIKSSSLTTDQQNAIQKFAEVAVKNAIPNGVITINETLPENIRKVSEKAVEDARAKYSKDPKFKHQQMPTIAGKEPPTPLITTKPKSPTKYE